MHKAITRINTSVLVRNWSGSSEYITISCYRWDLHSCFFQTNRRIVCVFSVIDMPEISEGAKLSHLSISNNKAPICVHTHTTYDQFWDAIWTHLWKQQRSQHSADCNLLMTSTQPSPAAAVLVIQSHNTVTVMIYILNQRILGKSSR